MIITGAKFYITIAYVIFPLFSLLLLIVGLGLILAVLNTYFTDIGYLYNVFTLILMYASAMFYPIEIVPARVQMIFTLNPIYSAISCFRECILYGIPPTFSTLLYLTVFGITVFLLGLVLFNIYEKKLTLEL